MNDHTRWGEYYMERTPEEIKDLRAENRAQNLRLEAVERGVTELRVALVGIDENNGLRGELREHKEYTRSKLGDIEGKLDKIIPSMIKGMITGIGVVGTIVGIIAGIVRIL